MIIIMYLLISYVKWDFGWILYMPEWGEDTRFMFGFAFVIFLVIDILIIPDIVSLKLNSQRRNPYL